MISSILAEVREFSEVDGPAWCTPGLDGRGGRYPLSVESAVLTMVDKLVPGVSTLTRFVRYYALYWALADFAEERALDTAACRTVLRRAEVALALASLAHDRFPLAHGVDRVRALRDKGKFDALTEPGQGSYSPRLWGFWSQYNGPSVALGTVQVQDRALRPGRLPCPDGVRQMFRPLLNTVASRDFPADEVAELSGLALEHSASPDLTALREPFTATENGQHDPADWLGDDRTRRATLRLLTRAVQLVPGEPTWAGAFRACIAYGAIQSDPVLSAEADRAYSWRGVLLRHHSVGAWRRLWAGLVDHVIDLRGSATRNDLYDWISAEMPTTMVRKFVSDCPPLTDRGDNPLPAEEEVRDSRDSTAADLSILLLGGLRLGWLSGAARAAFLGDASRNRGQFLDPKWVSFRHQEHEAQPVAELARAFVDDMLAQSRRVALGKMQVGADGRMLMFTKLHERNGRYFAEHREGAGNVGLRIDQLGGVAEQLGLLQPDPGGTTVTPLAAQLLTLPA